MALGHSLRKSIAASLAFTMLTVPLAGCGSDRGLTTGGITGKGVLGDLAVGGFYGGVMGAFLGGEKLPEGAFTVELPRPNDERLVVEAVGMDALRYYVHARVATKKLSRMNAKNTKIEEYVKQLRETAALWERAELFAEAAQKLGAALAKKETKPGYKSLAMIDKSPFGREMFFSVAYAKDTESEDRYITDAEKIKKGMDAEKIIQAYDRYPAGKHISGLAKELGVDAKAAHQRLEKATNDLNDKIFGLPTGYSNKEAAEIYDVGMRTSAAADGACRTGMFVGGMILAAPVLAPAGATPGIQAGVFAHVLADFADTGVNVMNDLNIVITGDEIKGIEETKELTGNISALTGGFMLLTSLKDFAIRGPKAVEEAQKILKAGNLNPQGFLDQYKIGSAGVQTAFTGTLWGKDRLEQLREGKIFFFRLYSDKKGNAVYVPTNKVDLPKEFSQISDSELRFLMMMQNEMLAEIMKKLEKEGADLTAEIVKEDARRWEEIGKAEARRRKEIEAELEKNKRNRGGIPSGTASSISLGDAQKQSSSQQTTENLPYAASKLAGRYTIIDPQHPEIFAARVIIKAQDDKTIRAIRVNKWTDKKGDVLFVARIDPKTGRALQQGLDLKFSYSEAAGAYTGIMEEQTISDKSSGILRMVQH